MTSYGGGYRLRGTTVNGLQKFHGRVPALRDGREVAARLLGQGTSPPPLESAKRAAAD